MSQWDGGHYLPHRPVVKEGGTTRVRPVFDASAKEHGQPSLNQCVEKGTNLIEIIPALLLRFRLHRIGIITDIWKAFLQISLSQEDRDFLRFLWVTAEGALKIFRHTRVAFDVTSSPFPLGAVIDFHLKYSEGSEETIEYTISTIEKLRKSFYVDSYVTSVENDKELRLFAKEASLVLSLTWDRKVDILAVSWWEWRWSRVGLCYPWHKGCLTPLILPVPSH